VFGRIDGVYREMVEECMPPIQSLQDYMNALRSSFDAPRAAGQRATLQYIFTGSATGACYAVIADGAVTVVDGMATAPSVTVTSDFDVWMRVIAYHNDPLIAYQEGMFAVEGDMEKLLESDTWFRR
jgi:putative sterol carrier protein